MTRATPETLAAAVTPLRAEPSGATVDPDGIESLAAFYCASQLDGLLVLGTTGEGVLLSVSERRAAATAFIDRAGDRLRIVVHCGAQSTRDTCTLAQHAAAVGASGVAVIAPPYYAFDERSLLDHFAAAAAACAPLPFYVYEFAARSGYTVPLPVIQRLRDSASNLAGLKVSDTPFESVEPYLLPGLDVYIGAEGLIAAGLARGAAGAVSGLAAAFPELTVRAVRSGREDDAALAAAARSRLQRFPFQAALKRALRSRGVSVESVVAAPLRDLDAAERAELDHVLAELDTMRQSTAVSGTAAPS